MTHKNIKEYFVVKRTKNETNGYDLINLTPKGLACSKTFLRKFLKEVPIYAKDKGHDIYIALNKEHTLWATNDNQFKEGGFMIIPEGERTDDTKRDLLVLEALDQDELLDAMVSLLQDGEYIIRLGWVK